MIFSENRSGFLRRSAKCLGVVMAAGLMKPETSSWGLLASLLRASPHLIDNLVDYVTIESNQEPSVVLSTRELLESAKQKSSSSIRASEATIVYEDLPDVTGVPHQLGLLFEHLLQNAIKFRRSIPPNIKVRASLGEGRYLFEFKDNGIGFAPEFAERVFLLFKRLHVREILREPGIGLALCGESLSGMGERLGRFPGRQGDDHFLHASRTHGARDPVGTKEIKMLFLCHTSNSYAEGEFYELR